MLQISPGQCRVPSAVFICDTNLGTNPRMVLGTNINPSTQYPSAWYPKTIIGALEKNLGIKLFIFNWAAPGFGWLVDKY